MRWEHLDEMAKCKVYGFEVRLDGGAGKRAGHTKLEVNFNAKDTKDHPSGVWTLPPTLRGRLDVEKYLAIGESDRMTLKFINP